MSSELDLRIVRLGLYDRVWFKDASCKYVYCDSYKEELKESDCLSSIKNALAIFERPIRPVKNEYVCIKVDNKMRDDIKEMIEDDEE